MKRHSCTFRLVIVSICDHQGAVKLFSNCPHSSAVDGTVNKWFIAAWRSVLITSALSPPTPTPHTPSTTTTRSSQAQLKLHLNIGMFKEVYNSDSPCPPQVTQFLFKVWLPPATSWLEIHFDCEISVYVDAVKCSLFCVCCWSPPLHLSDDVGPRWTGCFPKDISDSLWHCLHCCLSDWSVFHHTHVFKAWCLYNMVTCLLLFSEKWRSAL